MREEVRGLQKKLRVTVVYVTLYQSEAMAMLDMIVAMRNAGIAQAGSPRELYENPDNIFVATFMGEANRTKGLIETITGDHALLALDTAKLTLPHRGLGVGEVDLFIRPEAIKISGGALLPHEIAGTVATSIYMGANAKYQIDTAARRLFVIDPNHEHIKPPGTRIRIGFADQGVFIVKP